MRYAIILVLVLAAVAGGSYYYLSNHPDRAADLKIRTINLALRTLPLPQGTAQELRERRDRTGQQLRDAAGKGQFSLAEVLVLTADSAESDGAKSLSDRQRAYIATRDVMQLLFALPPSTASGAALKDAAENPALLARGAAALHALNAEAQNDASQSLPCGTSFLVNEIIGQVGAAEKWSGLHANAAPSSVIDYVLKHDALLDLPQASQALHAAVTLVLTDPRLDEAGRAALNRFMSPQANGESARAVRMERSPGSARLLGGSEAAPEEDAGPAVEFASMPECPPDPRCPD